MKKVFKNVFASALPQIMNIITNLILPPLIIARFGSEINGLVSSTKAIIAYISIIGAGIATATTQSLYEPVAKKDTLRIKGVLKASNRMFNKYGAIYCAIAIIVAFSFPFSLKTDIKYISIVLLMIVMSISGASEFFAVGRCRSLLYANQKTYVCSLIQAISIAGSLLLALLMLKLHTNIILVQFSISFVYVLRAFFLTEYVKKFYPELANYRDADPLYEAVAKKNDAMIHQLTGLAVLGSQTTILTIMVGLQAASIYSVYNIVFSGLQSICSNLSTAVSPFIGRELALDNQKKMLKMYDLIEYAFFNLVTFVYSVSMIMIVPFVNIYTRNADISYTYPSFAIIFAFASAFYILKMPSNSLINISGQFKETKWRAILEAVLTVVLGIVLTKFFGMNGVVLGSSVAIGWRCLDTIIYTNKHVLKCGISKSLFRLGRVFLILCIMACLSVRLTVVANDYRTWCMYSLIIAVTILVLLIITSIVFDLTTVKVLLNLTQRRKHNE